MDQRSATEVASACPPKKGRLLKWMTACRSCHSYSVTVQPPYNLSKIFQTSVRSLNIHPHPQKKLQNCDWQGFLYVFVPLSIYGWFQHMFQHDQTIPRAHQPGPLAIDQLGVHQRLEECGRGLLFAAHGEGLTLLQRCSDLMCDGKHGSLRICWKT